MRCPFALPCPAAPSSWGRRRLAPCSWESAPLWSACCWWCSRPSCLAGRAPASGGRNALVCSSHDHQTIWLSGCLCGCLNMRHSGAPFACWSCGFSSLLASPADAPTPSMQPAGRDGRRVPGTVQQPVTHHCAGAQVGGGRVADLARPGRASDTIVYCLPGFAVHSGPVTGLNPLLTPTRCAVLPLRPTTAWTAASA